MPSARPCARRAPAAVIVRQLLVELVAAHPRQVVALGIEEQLGEDLGAESAAAARPDAAGVASGGARPPACVVGSLRRVVADHVASSCIGITKHAEMIEPDFFQDLDLLRGISSLTRAGSRPSSRRRFWGATRPRATSAFWALNVERFLLVESSRISRSPTNPSARSSTVTGSLRACGPMWTCSHVVHVEAELHTTIRGTG